MGRGNFLKEVPPAQTHPLQELSPSSHSDKERELGEILFMETGVMKQ